MYTHPEFRRRGVASMVVHEAIEWCRVRGYGRLRLHASEMGRSVYRKFGFKRGWEMRLDLEKTLPRSTVRRRALVRNPTAQA
jgi:GNAT superfamily N-acetyltransferase